MRSTNSFALLFAPAVICALLATQAQAAPAWKVASKSSSLTIYNRMKPGSDLKELKAIGIIKAPPWVCFNVVNDENRYPKFMPYTEISKVLKRRKDGTKVVYQLIDAPFVSDRDYTMLIRDRSRRLASGEIIYKKTWTGANKLGPKKKSGVVRVQTNEGYWVFKDHKGGKETKATYYLFTDPGGSLPSFVINAANGRAVPGIFEAIEEQAADKRYRQSKIPVADAQPEAPQATISSTPGKAADSPKAADKSPSAKQR